MTTNSRAMAMLMGLAAGLGAVAPGAERVPIPVTAPVMRRSKRQVLRDIGYASRWNYPGHPGTVAQNKRAAVKAKNRARHRAACRG